MPCPNCGAPRGPADQICKRCHFHFALGRVVDLAPPRASDPVRARLGPPIGARLAGALRRDAKRARAVLRSSPWIPFGASVVPGLGHALAGAPTRGAVFFALVGGLLALSVPLFSSLVGQVVFGLALAAHAYCMFELSPWSRAEAAGARIRAIVGIQVCLLVLWWPLLRLLANAYVKAINTGYRQNDRALDVILGRAALAAVLVFALGIAVAVVVHWRRGRREGAP